MKNTSKVSLKAKAQTAEKPKAEKPKAAPKAKDPRKDKDVRAKAREIAHAQLAEVPATAPCACGCGVTIKVPRFAPGHDAKLLSRLANAAIDEAVALSATKARKPKAA